LFHYEMFADAVPVGIKRWLDKGARAVGVPQPPTHVTLITTLSPKRYCGAMLWDLVAAGEANSS
jgi:hypothetical protein